MVKWYYCFLIKISRTGVFLYFFMNLVILPLSAIGHPAFGDFRWMAWSIGMHALFGVLCALIARRALVVTNHQNRDHTA